MNELGFSGAICSDPSGGHWTSPPLTTATVSAYEKMIELYVPAWCTSALGNPNFPANRGAYINATRPRSCNSGGPCQDFPTLRHHSHGGGAVPYHGDRSRARAGY